MKYAVGDRVKIDYSSQHWDIAMFIRQAEGSHGLITEVRFPIRTGIYAYKVQWDNGHHNSYPEEVLLRALPEPMDIVLEFSLDEIHLAQELVEGGI